MPIKGIILIFLFAIPIALIYHNEIYEEVTKIFTKKKDEDEKE